ncbi:MAG: hypothetical protein J3Q66DRAFT_425667 [Benniella sp.]|nr:MAG: hypothetical protein J3Q66DRAFT_425667 [Benniella sp.]
MAQHGIANNYWHIKGRTWNATGDKQRSLRHLTLMFFDFGYPDLLGSTQSRPYELHSASAVFGPKVLVYVLIALSCFTATENLHILETGLPSQYIRERILVSSDTLVVNEYSLVIGKLVRHELQHMRRGLYKDAAFKKATPEAQTGPQELDRLQGLLRLCQAMSSINGSLELSIQKGERTGDRSAETIRVRQSYRNMMTALKDVSFTDHLVERISALEGWTSLFGNMWDSSDDAQTMVVAETMIGKVYKQLADGYRPFSEAVLRGRSQRPFSEAVLRGRSQRPFSEAVLRGRSQRPFSEVVLRGFSDRLQLTLPAPTHLCLSAAVALPSSSQASRTTTTEEEAAAVEKIKNITQKDLESFQQQVFSSQALARLLSAPWYWRSQTGPLPRRRTQGAGRLAGSHHFWQRTSRGLQPQLFNFTVPSCHMITHQSRGEKPFLERDLGLHRTHPLVGSHGLLSYLASPINPRAMASLCLRKQDAQSQISIDVTGPQSWTTGSYDSWSYRLPCPSIEGRLTCAEESALLIAISTSQYEPEDRKIPISQSLFYYSHGGGVLNDLLYRLTITQPQKSSLRLSWLQRIMDVLVLMSSQDESFERGVICFLKGAVLLWGTEQDIGPMALERSKVAGRIDDPDQVSVKVVQQRTAIWRRALAKVGYDQPRRDRPMRLDDSGEAKKMGSVRKLTLTRFLKVLGMALASLTLLPLSTRDPLEVPSVRYLSAEVITERGPWTCQHRLRELTAGIQAGQDEEALQPLVFERLAALTRLKMLEILTPIPNSRRSMLGFRLECGLGQLAHWQHLSVLRFSMEWYNINTPQVGMDDVAWMGLDSSRRLNQDRDFDAAGNLPRKNFGHGGRPLGAW